MIEGVSHKEFEQFVSRLHRIIESEASIVKWNVSIPDPDVPDNPRQIDILIDKNGFLTHIECRYRTKKQGSDWVEQLYGRKRSAYVSFVVI